MRRLIATVLYGLCNDVSTLARRPFAGPSSHELPENGEYIPAFDRTLPKRSASYGPQGTVSDG